MFGNFRLTAVLEAVICLLDRNTVAWYPFSLIFLPFLSSFNTFIETLPVLFYLTICFFLSPCSWYHSVVFVRNPWLVNVDAWLHVRQFSFDCSFTCGHMPAGSQHCGMIPIQSDFRSILSWFNNFMKLCRFSFIWQIVFFPVAVFFVLHWYISSRSLVGERWCLRWCLVIFVWLQC